MSKVDLSVGGKSVAVLAGHLSQIIDLARDNPEIPGSMLDEAKHACADLAFATDFPSRPLLPQAQQLSAIASNLADAPLGAALTDTLSILPWTQNPNYRGRPEFADYLSVSTYCMLTGSGGLVANDQVWSGLFIMGANTDYPAHAHPALEAYFILSGTAIWWREGENPIARPEGSTVFHDRMRSHAMRTLNEPLLCYFLQSGELGPHAVPSV
ncbi:hypothetical protein KVP09_06535 [Alcaligenaceae bacterium CGII-47]|nr:hypothetical protein [Alcaligenaceae bacterium CGII-47]